MLPLSPCRSQVAASLPVVLELHVEVPADRVRTEVDKAYLTLARKAHVQGLPSGQGAAQRAHAPVRSAGRERRRERDREHDAAEGAHGARTSRRSTSRRSRRASSPSDEAFSYKARFEVQPEIEDVKYEGFELVRPPTRGRRRRWWTSSSRRSASATPRSKAPEPARPAQKGDVLTIDFTIDGRREGR